MKWESYSRYQGGVGNIAERTAIHVRKQMFDTMLALAKVTPQTRVLDVGATSEDRPGTNFVEELYPYKDSLTATGLEDASWLETKYPGVKFVHADAGRLPFDDGAFDFVIASAMIEHVGSRENQRAVVRELLRVGKKVCLTTPNRYFPLEFHTVVPLLHWLPAPVFRASLRKLGRDYFATEENLNLLSARDLRKLVPPGRKTTLKRFRLLGWTSNLLLFIELDPARAMPKTAFVTGITGQDGAYLAAHLLGLGYAVVGGVRPNEEPETWRLEELGVLARVSFVPFELLEADSIARAIEQVQPTEVYNLAAQSSVASSLKEPLHTADVDGLGVVRLLEAVRLVNVKIRVFQASSADMFGEARTPRQNEDSPFFPKSPYAVAKLFAHHSVGAYRDSFGLYAASGILFNHESPMRGSFFVTRKITQNFALRKARPAEAQVLELGNMATKRDWGFAGDYVAAMHAMLQRETARDYVLATGVTHSVRDFVDFSAEAAGFSLEWRGEGAQTTAHDTASGDVLVRVNPAFFRPTEVDGLSGDASRARDELGFAPTGTLRDLARLMVEADVARLARG